MAQNNGNLISIDSGTVLDAIVDGSGNPPSTGIWDTGLTITTIEKGYQISIFARNKSLTNQKPLRYTFDLGVSTGTLPKPSSIYWVSDHVFRPWPPGSGSQTASRWAKQNMGYPGNEIYAPVVALSNQTDVVAFSTDYFYGCEYLGVIQNGRYKVTMANYYAADDSSPAPNDWFAPGEERTFNVWIKGDYVAGASGVPTGVVIGCLQPFIDRMKELYPCRQYKRYNGRIHALYMAQAEAPTGYRTTSDNPKRYWCYDSRDPGEIMGRAEFNDTYDVHPEYTDNWFDYLDSAVDVDELKRNGYVAILLDASTGHTDSSKDLLPNNITKLPTHLYNKLPQLVLWSKRTGLDVLFYAGYGGHKIQLDGAWDVDPTGLPNSGYYNYAYATSNLTSLVRPFISEDRWQRLRNEFENGMFTYANGAICDAFPSLPQYTWAQEIATRWQEPYRRGIYLAQESTKPLINALFFPICHFPDTAFLGRCPLMEAIIPGYQPCVFTNRSPNYTSDAPGYKDRIQAIESQGAICITIGKFGFVDRPFLGEKEGTDLSLRLGLRGK